MIGLAKGGFVGVTASLLLAWHTSVALGFVGSGSENNAIVPLARDRFQPETETNRFNVVWGIYIRPFGMAPKL
jgi:hypothetical protein